MQYSHLKALATPGEIEKHLSDLSSLIITKSEQNLAKKTDLWKSSEPGVIAWDWDGTITINGPVEALGRDQGTIWQEIKTILAFTERSITEMKTHYERWGRSKDEGEQLAWSDATYEVYRREGVTKAKLEMVANALYLRPGALELIRKISEKGHHQCIISYGLKDLIEVILKKNGLEDTVTVFADSLIFDENGLIIGADTSFPRIVAANKIESLNKYIQESNIANIHKTLFIGDSVHDLQVIEATNGLGVYLHHLGHKAVGLGAAQEMSQEADIIVVNNTDNTLGQVTDFVERLINCNLLETLDEYSKKKYQ